MLWTEEHLNKMLSTPSQRLTDDIKKIEGDLIVLGAGGKMGPTLCLLAKNAIREAGINKRIIAVSRFTDSIATRLLNDNGIETISADLLEPGILDKLPDVPNVIFMAGRKFGTNGQEAMTWAMNGWLPALVAERYKNSRIVVFSSGNIYSFPRLTHGGATEQSPTEPVGEYAMTCLARERMFEYASNRYGTKVFLYRLAYAVDLRYGVLYDIAEKVMNGQPISVSMPLFNCIWQGDANEIALRALLHASSPALKMNVTGPETVSVRYAASEFGKLFGKEPVLTGEESDRSLIVNSALCMETFGYPAVSLRELIKWQAEWILSGGRSLGKPTHFEEIRGKY